MADPNIFFWIAASVAEASAINPKGTKTLLANGLNTFPITGKPVFSNSRRSLPKSPPKCIILDNWVFENFILADEPFTKALRIIETCVLVKKDLWEKLVSSSDSPTAFDGTFIVNWVPSYSWY